MFKYSEDQCDVEDKESLRKYRDRRSEWISWLQGKDYHSIWNQIHALVWNDCLFRTINRARFLASQSGSDTRGLNFEFFRLFDSGYVAVQTTAIRRLTDRSPENNPDRTVISVRRLLTDIETHLQLVTRENYVSYDGLPYDPRAPL